MFDWVTGIVERTGYFGVTLLMFVENLFPPIPSELIMPLAGFTAARGDLNIVLVVLAGTVGSLLGTTLWYYIGKRVGCGRLKQWTAAHGRWFTISPDGVDRASDWFRRHGRKAVLIGRLIPAVRTLVSVPAGVAGMPLVPFLIYSAFGTVVWSGLLAGAGYLLEGQYQDVAGYLNPASNLVMGLIVLYYLYRVVTIRQKPS